MIEHSPQIFASEEEKPPPPFSCVPGEVTVRRIGSLLCPSSVVRYCSLCLLSLHGALASFCFRLHSIIVKVPNLMGVSAWFSDYLIGFFFFF